MKDFKKRKCVQCKEVFTPIYTSVQPCCSYICALIYTAIKEEKKKAKAWKDEKKVLKAKLKTLPEWKKDLQIEINKIARLIDFGQPCIATGKHEGKMNGGHYLSVASNPTVRFNLHNIHIQSEHSNSWKSGDTIRYQDGIVRIYGQKYLDSMNALKSHPVIKLGIEDVRSRISVAKNIIKYHLPEGEIYSPPERVCLRVLFNETLGIYK